jgi:hypothetical protein
MKYTQREVMRKHRIKTKKMKEKIKLAKIASKSK